MVELSRYFRPRLAALRAPFFAALRGAALRADFFAAFAAFRAANAKKFRGFLAPEAIIKTVEAAVKLADAEGLAALSCRPRESTPAPPAVTEMTAPAVRVTAPATLVLWAPPTCTVCAAPTVTDCDAPTVRESLAPIVAVLDMPTVGTSEGSSHRKSPAPYDC